MKNPFLQRLTRADAALGQDRYTDFPNIRVFVHDDGRLTPMDSKIASMAKNPNWNSAGLWRTVAGNRVSQSFKWLNLN
jgi:hypothetical protein